MSTPDTHPIIVVGFDGSAASHVALSRAIQRVGPGGKLYLVHAWHTDGRDVYGVTLGWRQTAGLEDAGILRSPLILM